jgi:Tfp pilus assembly protein PilF
MTLRRRWLAALVLSLSVPGTPALAEEVDELDRYVDPQREKLSYQQWMDRGYRAKNIQDLRSASQAFEAATEAKPHELTPWLELAYTAVALAEATHAEAHYQAALHALAVSLTRGGEPASLWLQYGYTTVQYAEHCERYRLLDRARLAFLAAGRAGADTALVQLELGFIASKQGRTTDAAGLFRRALNEAEATVLSDASTAEQKELARRVIIGASSQLDASSLAHDPDEIGQPDWFQLGLEYKSRGELEDARAAFVSALDAGAEPETVHAELGYLALTQGRTQQALEHFELAGVASSDRRERSDEIMDEEWAEGGRDGPPPSETHHEYGAWVEERSGSQWLELAWQRKAEGNFTGAITAFEAARLLGADAQLIMLELGYLEVLRQEPLRARTHFLGVISWAEEITEERPNDFTALQLAWDRAGQARAELRALGLEATTGGDTEPVLEDVMTRNASDWLQIGWKQREKGHYELSRRAFEAAAEWGADPELIALELGYLEQAQGHQTQAVAQFEKAARIAESQPPSRSRSISELRETTVSSSSWAAGRQGVWYEPPDPETPGDWLQLAYNRKATGDLEGAEQAFLAALAAGGDEASIALELGYLAHARGDYAQSEARFRQARQASSSRIRAARDELQALEPTFWGEAYGQVFGWHRFYPSKRTNLLPFLQVRGFWHPIEGVDFDPYVYVNASRDLASRGEGPLGYPVIYADNTLGLGVGALYRTWERQAGIFAQLGTAINLLNDDRQRVWFDMRVGAYVDLEREVGCHPEPAFEGVTTPMEFCWEAYGELVYVSRYDHNIIAQARGRAGATAMVTGRVAWQPLVEARVNKDLLNDYWNNLAELGAVHRWRLLDGIPLDLMVGLHFGSYFGLFRDDTPPSPLSYAELRLLLESGFNF